jgi:FAD/FMN-containing dehydrogenase
VNNRHQNILRILPLFQEILGPKGYTEDSEQIAPWLTDWRGLYHGQAHAMLSPASTQEVAKLVALADHHRVALVPQGGNTSMVGGATPSEDGGALILSLRRMNNIRSLDGDAGVAVAEAGVILSAFHDAASAVGMRFPLSLGAKGSATLGGLVSTNAGGTQVLRFGTMRKLVLGLEAVLPDGSVFNGLVPLKKDNRGYDLTQLLIGAEGTLGVVTAGTFQLVPIPGDHAVAWVGVESPQAALTLLRAMEAESGEAVESFELIPDPALTLVLRHIPGTRAPLQTSHPWHILIDYAAPKEAGTELEALLGAMLDAGLARDATIALNSAQGEAFWKLRDSISEAERAEGPLVSHDISVAVDDMPRFMADAAKQVESAFSDAFVTAYGHLGDGNVHFHVRAAGAVDAASWRAQTGKAASQLVYDLVVHAGGSISAEHGIGQMKRDELARLSDPVRINVLRAIKNALDPAGIMNPGKLVPLAPDAVKP